MTCILMLIAFMMPCVWGRGHSVIVLETAQPP